MWGLYLLFRRKNTWISLQGWRHISSTPVTAVCIPMSVKRSCCKPGLVWKVQLNNKANTHLQVAFLLQKAVHGGSFFFISLSEIKSLSATSFLLVGTRVCWKKFTYCSVPCDDKLWQWQTKSSRAIWSVGCCGRRQLGVCMWHWLTELPLCWGSSLKPVQRQLIDNVPPDSVKQERSKVEMWGVQNDWIVWNAVLLIKAHWRNVYNW